MARPCLRRPFYRLLLLPSVLSSPLAAAVKVGLAHALAKIISNRSKQSNFQLVTITHDEVKLGIDSLSLTKRVHRYVEAMLSCRGGVLEKRGSLEGATSLNSRQLMDQVLGFLRMCEWSGYSNIAMEGYRAPGCCFR